MTRTPGKTDKFRAHDQFSETNQFGLPEGICYTQCTLNQWQNFTTPGRSMSRTACYHKEEAWRTALQKGHHGRTDSSSPQWTASHSHSHTRGQKFVTQQKGGPKSGRKSWPSLFTKSPFACRILLSEPACTGGISRTKHGSDCNEKCPSNRWDYSNFSDLSLAMCMLLI